MKRLIVMTVAAVGLLAAGYFLAWTTLAPAVTKPPLRSAPATVLASQEPEVPPLERWAAAPRFEPLPPVSAEIPAPTASASAAAPEDVEPAPNQELTREEVLTNLEVSFETETIDAQWGVPVAREIYDTVRPILGRNSEVRSVDCRSSMCRVESVQEDQEHFDSFVTKLKRSNISHEGFYSQTGATPDGKKVMTMYLARRGHPLPKE
jgi:hypothetical protein